MRALGEYTVGHPSLPSVVWGKVPVFEMELDDAVVLCFAYRRWKRRKQIEKRQQYIVHPILTDRGTHGVFVTLYPNLRKYEIKFVKYLRMSIQSFDDLLELIREGISPCEKYVQRNVVSAEEKLVITLR